MKLVIDIPNDAIENLKIGTKYNNYDICGWVMNGTIIPEGHGKLKDTDKISDRLKQLRDSWNYYGNEYEGGMYNGYDCSLDEVMDAPTIIEANK